MAGIMAAAQQAAPKGDTFKKPDISKLVPAELKDTVDRVFAAGMKMLYSPAMAQERQQGIQSQDPAPKKISDNVLGLLLTLDQKSNGGIPQAALFPVALELAGEAATILVTAGQPVTQDDFNNALLMLYVGIGKKLGGKPDELLGAASQALQNKGQSPDDAASASAAPPVDPAAANAPPMPAGGAPAGGAPTAPPGVPDPNAPPVPDPNDPTQQGA